MSPTFGPRLASRRSRSHRPPRLERLETRRLPSSYTITSLGTFGGPTSYATGINRTGEVVGAADTKRYYWIFDATHDKGYYADAFLWTPTAPNGSKGSMTDLGTLAGFDSEARGVNDFGQVIGLADLQTTEYFLWTPSASGGTSGSMTVLNGLGGPATRVTGINPTGQVVGSAMDSSGTNDVFLWNPLTPNSASVTPIDLSTSVGLTSAIAINAAGQVLGTYHAADGTRHTCLWTPTSLNPPSGSILDLGTFAGTCLNNSGEVAGRIGSDLGLYVNGGTYDLGTLYTGINGAAAISNTGQIVGSAHLSSGADHAFLWTPSSPNGTAGTLSDINLLTGSNSTTLSGASGINDLGQIAGFGTINNGSTQALLLTPNTIKPNAIALTSPAVSTWDPTPAFASLAAPPADVVPAPAGPVGSLFDVALDQIANGRRHRKLAELL